MTKVEKLLYGTLGVSIANLGVSIYNTFRRPIVVMEQPKVIPFPTEKAQQQPIIEEQPEQKKRGRPRRAEHE